MLYHSRLTGHNNQYSQGILLHFELKYEWVSGA